METIDRLLAHDRWATGAVLDHCRALTEDQADQSFDIGHRTIRATLLHIREAIDYWTTNIGGPPLDPLADESLGGIITGVARAQEAFIAMSAQMLAAHEPDATFSYGGHPLRYSTAITHVALHDALHRSELLHVLQRLGVDGLWDYDFIEWEWNSQGG